MVYALGLKEVFELLVNGQQYTGHPMVKKGRSDTYEGAAVFRTIQDADRFRRENDLQEFAVVEVKAEWGTDTIQNETEPYHNLLETRPVVRVVETLWTP